EEHLARELLAHLAGEVSAAVARVEGADVGVGLLEAPVLAAGDREVAHDARRVATARRPAGHEGDDDLRHEADEALHLEDVEAADAGSRYAAFGGYSISGGGVLAFGGYSISGGGVLVAALAPDALVAARAEGPAAVLR